MLRSIVLFLVILLLAHPAYADECNSPVFDTTGKVSASEVEPLLKKISGDGADPALVRVITTEQMNQNGNLDKYAGNLLGRCPSWQSAGGRLKSNIFLLILEPSGKVAVQFAKKGPFQTVLTHSKIMDITGEMGGLIAKGDLTGAAKAGLIRTHSILSTTKAESKVVTSGPVTIVNHNEKPADLSGLASFLKWLLVLGVIGAGIWLFGIYQSKKAERGADRQRAQGSLANCNNMIHSFDERLTLLGSLLNSYKSLISASEFQDLQSRVSELNRSASYAKSQFASSLGSSNDPENVGLSSNQYDVMIEVFDRNLQSLNKVDRSLTDLEATIKNISKLRDAAQPAIDSLTSEIESATNTVNAERTLKTDGPRATLQQAINFLERAQKSLEGKGYQAVANFCKEGTALARKASQQVRDLTTRKQQVELDIQRLSSNDMSGKLASIDSLINEIKTTFGAGSETSALQERAVVIQRTKSRQAAISVAKSSLLTQNWDSAEQQITAAKSAESDIDHAISTVKNLNHRLKEASRPKVSSYRPSSNHSGHSHVNHTTVVNNYGRRDDDGPGFGTGLGVGLLAGVALDSALSHEDRRDSWGSSRRSSDDDDRGFGGGSVQTSSNDDDGDRGFGGESIDTSSNDDSSSDFSSNDSSSSDD
jgi:hypothetical protein